MASQFEFEIADSPEGLVVRVRGELDLTAADAFVEACRSAIADGRDGDGRNGDGDGSGAPVVLDLRPLEFMDSTGLRALLAIRESAQSAGHRFAVVRGNRQVQRLLELTKVADQLDLVEHPSAVRGAAHDGNSARDGRDGRDGREAT